MSVTGTTVFIPARDTPMDREYGDTRMAKSRWNDIHNNDERIYGEILYEQYTSPPSDDRVYSFTKCR